MVGIKGAEGGFKHWREESSYKGNRVGKGGKETTDKNEAFEMEQKAHEAEKIIKKKASDKEKNRNKKESDEEKAPREKTIASEVMQKTSENNKMLKKQASDNNKTSAALPS